MIKANELRIGNWLQHNENWCYRSDELKPFLFQWEERDWYWLNEYTMSLDDCEPIILIPEILKKCGVEKYSDRYKLDVNDRITIFFTGHPISLYAELYAGEYIEGEAADLDIKYLHQLQNLYLALTGKELQVNLTELQLAS